MIFIHGINHNTQHTGNGSDPEGVAKLTELIENYYNDGKIDVIAEEFSVEACELSNVENSVCQLIARRLNVKHIFCDPTSKERANLNIPSKADLLKQAKKDLGVSSIFGKNKEYYKKLSAKYHKIRESFWLKKIEKYKNDNVFFICGNKHIDSFVELLITHKWSIEIV